MAAGDVGGGDRPAHHRVRRAPRRGAAPSRLLSVVSRPPARRSLRAAARDERGLRQALKGRDAVVSALPVDQQNGRIVIATVRAAGRRIVLSQGWACRGEPLRGRAPERRRQGRYRAAPRPRGAPGEARAGRAAAVDEAARGVRTATRASASSRCTPKLPCATASSGRSTAASSPGGRGACRRTPSRT
ncbi:uncharacterized protein SOCE26_091390 [Sorangium cellulosum]|uniref:Uncharacterized protein n=1 Tax=Sorangium cellulosum TaxID=56 RepID=A0A2L0F7W8_SORCE|nr:uncharacterized protein SOCE26_091390 [Sorangium cellulosum]